MKIMRINGKNYKSLNFTLLKEKLVNETKTQTCRTRFVPSFEENEIIVLKFKGVFLYFAKITSIYAKRIKDLDLDEAKRDGFKSIKEFQEKLMELNHIKSKNHWAFIIRFEKYKDPQQTLTKQGERKKEAKIKK